jgi:hypothetical protein
MESPSSILGDTHRILVIMENGERYTSKCGSMNTSWADACRFILQAGCKVHSLVPYKLEVSYV